MQLTQSAVSPSHSLIEGLAVLRTTAQPSERTLVAESRLSIGIRIAGDAQVLRGASWDDLPRFTLTGLHCGSRAVRRLPDSCLVLAHLHPAAASALGVKARQILGLTRDLSEVWPRHELDALAQGLSVGPDDSARMAMLETYVALRLTSGPAVDAMVQAAVEHIRAAPTHVRIALLARTLGVSVDTLERRFTASVGVSPKRFARAARLRSAVLSYAPDMSLTDLAMGAGYYDQPHFVREMQGATGHSPSRLLPGRGYC
jgi:AraC-like DNA-binding protein